MAHRDDADSSRDLLLALIALERGLVDQDRLLVAFEAWTQSPGRSMAEILASQGAVDERGRRLLEDLVEEHRDRPVDGRTGPAVAAAPNARSASSPRPSPTSGRIPFPRAIRPGPHSINERFRIVRRYAAGGWARSSWRSIPSSIARSRSRSCGLTTRTTRSARRGSCSRPG